MRDSDGKFGREEKKKVEQKRDGHQCAGQQRRPKERNP